MNMRHDEEREVYLDLAERMLDVCNLEDIFDENDLTQADVLSYLIELGLINTEYFGGIT